MISYIHHIHFLSSDLHFECVVVVFYYVKYYAPIYFCVHYVLCVVSILSSFSISKIMIKMTCTTNLIWPSVKCTGGETASVKCTGGETASVKCTGGETASVKCTGGETSVGETASVKWRR